MSRMSMAVLILGEFDVFREPGLDHERGFWKLQSRNVSIVLNDGEAEEMAKKLRKRAKERTKGECVGANFSGVNISLKKRDALKLADMLEGKA